ncbi:uncharacterized protein [Rhodnius prolixus]|uniref:uncharacterized protein n=1 Tax=Rhodnius prolixus TaxID=13249 RepID=UPI003D189205
MASQVRKSIATTEIEEKNRKIRLKWFEKHHEMLKLGGDEQDIQVSPLVQKLIDEVAKMRKERYEKDRQIEKQKRADREEARKKQLAEEVTEIDPEILMRGPMYPVEEEIKELLYKGFSANMEGRWLYLKLRNKKAPYEKYYEPQSTQNDYGWKIEERSLIPNKQFARKGVIKPQFFRRTGAKAETLRNRPPYSGKIQMEHLT